jgi:predicted TIM-barrel fold metal-dependent hydrolase
MAQARQAVNRLEQVDEVVDCDFHLTERQEDLMPYLPDPWGKMFQRGMEEDAEDYGVLSSFYPLPGSINTVTLGQADSDSVRSRAEVKAGMEKFHIDKAVTTPTLNLLLGAVRNEELAAAIATAYNRWQDDVITDADKGIYGTVIVSPQNPEKGAEEIERWADDPSIVGVFLPPTGVIPFLGHPMYEPIYEAAERNGLPIFMHNSASTVMDSFPAIHRFLTRYFSIHTVSHPIQHICNVTDIITRGLPVKYPDLNWVIQEAGIGYIPFLMNRMDHQYHQNTEDVPMLEKVPSEYLKDQFYFTSQPIEGAENPEYVQDMVTHMGGDRTLMFSSDYPHFDFDNTDELMKLLAPFSEDEINNIYGQTAAGLLDI